MLEGDTNKTHHSHKQWITDTGERNLGYTLQTQIQLIIIGTVKSSRQTGWMMMTNCVITILMLVKDLY